MSESIVLKRHIENLRHDIEKLVPYLENKNVTDLIINSDGKLWIKEFGENTVYSDVVLALDLVHRIILDIASCLGFTIPENDPQLSGIMPIYNCRIHAWLPPWVPGCTLCIRKKPEVIKTLLDYYEEGRIAKEHFDYICEAVESKKNILVGGGTGSGKTTFLNALLAQISFSCPTDRLVIIEDTQELQCSSENHILITVPSFATDKVVEGVLRDFPTRIMFGELRNGETTLKLLNSWNTGHPGSYCTVHSDSAERMLSRVYDLVSQAVPGTIQKSFVSEVINICVFLKNCPPHGPKIVEVIEVQQKIRSDGTFNVKHIDGVKYYTHEIGVQKAS